MPTRTFINDDVGFYAQGTAKLGGLTLLGGIRHDRYVFKFRNLGNTAFDPNFVTTKTPYRVGASYALTRSLNIYAGYSTSFNPTNAYNFAGTPLPPETSKNKEVGLKLGTPSGRLSANVAAFDTKIDNAIIPDPDITHNGASAFGIARRGIRQLRLLAYRAAGDVIEQRAFPRWVYDLSGRSGLRRRRSRNL